MGVSLSPLVVVIVEMNPYSAFLDTLSGHQCLAAKIQLGTLKEVLHPHICRVLEVVDSPLSVRCEPPGTNVLRLYQAQSSTWNDDSLTKQFLGVVAGLSKTQAKVNLIQKIAHGRLSLEALYVNEESTIKVVGFGTFNGQPEHCPVGFSQFSPQYCSPEIKENQVFNVYKADLWALGICFLQLSLSSPLTGQETLEQLVQKASKLGPKLSHVLKLVFKPEAERADCISFQRQSGYCQSCWDSLDRGQSLCANCPVRVKEMNPLRIGRVPELPPDSGDSQVPQIRRRQLLVNASPELPKCRSCQRELKKINEKDICRLCLVKEKVAVVSAGNRPFPVAAQGNEVKAPLQRPNPAVPGRSNFDQSKVGQPSPALPLSALKGSQAQANPNKGKAVHFQEQADQAPAPGNRPGSFPNLSNPRQPQPGDVGSRIENCCKFCTRVLSRRSKWNQEFAQGYDEFCSEECIMKYMEFMDKVEVLDEISCMECCKPGSSEWIKLPCNEGHRFCSNACVSTFAKRAMGPSADATLVICPKCKTSVPQELVQQWRDGLSNQLGALPQFR